MPLPFSEKCKIINLPISCSKVRKCLEKAGGIYCFQKSRFHSLWFLHPHPDASSEISLELGGCSRVNWLELVRGGNNLLIFEGEEWGSVSSDKICAVPGPAALGAVSGCDVQRGRVIPAGRNESACKTRAPEAAGAAVARGQLLRKDALLENGLPGRFSTDQRSRRGGLGKGCAAAHMRLLGRKLLILNAISDAFLFSLIIFH